MLSTKEYKGIAGSEECFPKPIVYKRQKLLSNTTCTPRHDKETTFYEKN